MTVKGVVFADWSGVLKWTSSVVQNQLVSAIVANKQVTILYQHQDETHKVTLRTPHNPNEYWIVESIEQDAIVYPASKETLDKLYERIASPV